MHDAGDKKTIHIVWIVGKEGIESDQQPNRTTQKKAQPGPSHHLVQIEP